MQSVITALENVGSGLLITGVMLAAVVLAFLVAALLIQTLRRVLGAPVGRIRTFVISLIIVFSVPSITAQLFFRPEQNVSPEHVGWAPTLVVMGVVLLWLFALAAAILTLLEMIFPTGTVPNPVVWFAGRKARSERNRRYRQVMMIFVKHGLSANFGSRDSQSRRRMARALRDALEEAGIAFVKLGQNLSTRSDLLPPEFTEELSTLQSNVRQKKWADIAEALDEYVGEEHGNDYHTVFASIDHEPLAAASVAQVHRATLHNGDEVVAKVQRPGAIKQVNRDADIVVRICEWLENTTAWGKSLGIHDLGVGFANSLLEELDYREEATSMRDLANANNTPAILIPKAYPEFSSKRLLVMEFVSATPVGDADLSTLSTEQRMHLADQLVESVMHQVMEVGVFHADLHPGNVLLYPDHEHLGLLDFGAVGRLDNISQRQIVRLILSLENNDARMLTNSFIELLGRPENLNEHKLQRDLGDLLVRFRAGFESAQAFNSMIDVVFDHNFTIPQSVAAAFRTLAGLDSTISLISPESDLVASAKKAGGAVMKEKLRPNNLKDSATSAAVELLPTLTALPRRLDRITEQLGDGHLSMNMRVLANKDDRNFITWLLQQIVVAVLAAAFLLGGTVLIAFDADTTQIAGYVGRTSLIGYIVLFFGFMLALRAVTIVMKKG